MVLENLQGELKLVVEDDGVGFDLDPNTIFTGEDRGMGLIGMKERAELLGGSFNIESSVGNGTSVFVRVSADGSGV